ncbi:MAG: DUF4357 domain-containing protein [Mycoplasma sp.]|nr:DUF4357 domain-containing protein [Mycoplasma sp.]
MKRFQTIWFTDEEGIKIFFSNDSRILIHDIPRSNFFEVDKKIGQKFEESGLYILFQTSSEEDQDKSKVYIGEAYNVKKRVLQHLDETKPTDKSKLWTERIIIITSSSLSSYSEFTKSEVHFLEKQLIDHFNQNDKFIVDNKNKGQGREPNKIIEIQLKEEKELILTGLKNLGYDSSEVNNIIAEPNEDNEINSERIPQIKINALISKTKEVIDAILTANNNVVIPKDTKIKNSSRKAERNQSLVISVIKKLTQDNSIKNEGNYKDYDITFLKDVRFTNPSAASYLIAGGNANGWFTWKDEEDKYIDKYRR